MTNLLWVNFVTLYHSTKGCFCKTKNTAATAPVIRLLGVAKASVSYLHHDRGTRRWGHQFESTERTGVRGLSALMGRAPGALW